VSDLNTGGFGIEFTAPHSVNDLIASLGRTEDVCFSPNNRRLAVAAFMRHRVAIIDIDIASSAAGPRVALTHAVELSSPALSGPHGLDFIDDETLIVANRDGGVGVFKLPVGEIPPRCCEVLPIQTWPVGERSLLQAPGSVAVAGVARDLHEILVCNNSGHSVSRHHMDVQAGCVVSSEVLMRKWLDIPDGVAISPDRQWIAVSNHSTHDILLYENAPSLDENTDPAGILRGTHYPHGLRFTPDGRHLFVADAGAPHVQVYAENGTGWWGVRHPAATIRIMDEPLFLRGRYNPQEGGPKGLDIDARSDVLVATSQHQPLVFLDVEAVLKRASAGDPAERSRREQRAREVGYELSILAHSNAMKARAIEAEASVAVMKAQALDAAMKSTWSWRLRAPLRGLHSVVRRLT
jgi:DNA-binding beta-propeller fold protein YncE